jgi:hypothetical protein
MKIKDLIEDWGGFEKLVAELHETGEVTVEHDVVLKGRSGTLRQIDVLVRHKQGLYEHLIVVECKYWNYRVERLHVDALATTVREVGASRGVIFSTKGFQSGAITQAEHEKIDLFIVRELTEEEWGLPGRVVNLLLQIIQPSIGNLLVHNGTKLGNSANNKPIFLNFHFGPNDALSSTPTLTKDGSQGGNPVEEYILDGAQKALTQALGEGFTINSGAEGTRYMGCPVNLEFSSPLMIPQNGEIIIIPKISFHLGIKITQSRITVDRAQKYKFVLALENCINGKTSSASRRTGAAQTTLSDIVPAKDIREGEAPVVNGSILRVVINGFFPFEEMKDLEPVPDPRARP